MEDWFTIEEQPVPWLVHGLLANDSHSAFIGKPKSGKSSLIRNLAVAVVKGRDLLGRKVTVPTGGGRVLYIHLDRKDPIGDVAGELRKLGITQEESDRLSLMSADDMPNTKDERLRWLQEETKKFSPDLIIIDLLFHFINVSDSNGYNQVLNSINELQDTLRQCGFKGHTATAHHQRKASSEHDRFDDVLGSTSIRGSFATNLLLERDREKGRYTIQSDQTQRDKFFGELPETVLERNQDTGELSLGREVGQLEFEHKKKQANENAQRVLGYIRDNPGCTQNAMVEALQIRKEAITRILRDDLKPLLKCEGRGVANDPIRYTVEIPREAIQ